MKEQSARAARGSAPTPTHRDAASPPDGVLLRPGCARSCRIFCQLFSLSYLHSIYS